VAISYDLAVQQLLALGHELATNRKFDLDHMRVLAAALEHPERRFQSVLIAGTNGKGSTAATIASIVSTAGYRIGLYTSPHLMRINERIQIFTSQNGGEQISDVEFALMYERVNAVAEDLVRGGSLPWHPSFFEMLTAMAFEYFASTGVELAVLEVGMGGRLDATNVVEPCLSVITDIDFDHQKFLGNTLPEITYEKAGILRANVPVVLLPQHPVVNEALGHEILDHDAKAVSAVRNMASVTPASSTGLNGAESFMLSVLGEAISITPPLRGRHQLRNLALAITASEELNGMGFNISAANIEAGVRNTRWPGRFQVLPALRGFPEVVLDVAHNPAGAWALRSTLSTLYEDRKLTFIFGAMRDKAISEIAGILFPLADRVIVTEAGNPRAASAHDITELAQHTQSEIIEEKDVASALESASRFAGHDGVVVITGSIYLVGEAMGLLSRIAAPQDFQRSMHAGKASPESVKGV
jgi:dihydrofolate synthase / folylpolyglutamate synthase